MFNDLFKSKKQKLMDDLQELEDMGSFSVNGQKMLEELEPSTIHSKRDPRWHFIAERYGEFVALEDKLEIYMRKIKDVQDRCDEDIYIRIYKQTEEGLTFAKRMRIEFEKHYLRLRDDLPL